MKWLYSSSVFLCEKNMFAWNSKMKKGYIHFNLNDYAYVKVFLYLSACIQANFFY